MSTLNQIQRCIDGKSNFVVQGGAGSGKTESLKTTIHYTLEKYPNQKIFCITHTNAAANEITDRVGIHPNIKISTIHSFAYSIIKNYKKNIRSVMKEIFTMNRLEVDESDYDVFKKYYEEYQNKLFSWKRESVEKVTNKRGYAKSPKEYNIELNKGIEELNKEIEARIKLVDYRTITYNDAPYNNYNSLAYSHDVLLEITARLIQKYPIIRRVLRDKIDFLFIDEYQDSEQGLMRELIENIAGQQGKSPTVGMYGDAMQSIYDEGVGDVREWIENDYLIEIEKKDNFRCSRQVIDLINKLRDDDIEQELELKVIDGVKEKESEREGSVKLFYDFIKHGARTQEYDNHLQQLIDRVTTDNKGYKILSLTNKAISKRAGFTNLFDVFSKTYSKNLERIESDLESLQLFELIKIINAYKEGEHNYILTNLKRNGIRVQRKSDKEDIREKLNVIVTYRKKSIKQILDKSFELKLMKKSDQYNYYMDRKQSFIRKLEESKKYQKLKSLYNNKEITTHFKLQKYLEENESTLAEELRRVCVKKYEQFKRNLDKENMYEQLFSNQLKFEEVEKYYDYLHEKTEHITMHKTKGTGIENVIVVLDNFGWTKYDFRFPPADISKSSYKRAQKLFYVACSRTEKNLICIKLISDEEELNYLKTLFSQLEHINTTDIEFIKS